MKVLTPGYVICYVHTNERLTLDASDYVLSKHTLKDLLAPGGREDATQAPCEDPLGFSFLYDLEF